MKNPIKLFNIIVLIMTLLPFSDLSAQWTVKNNIPGLAAIQFSTVGDPSVIDAPAFHTYAIMYDSVKAVTSSDLNGYDLYVTDNVSYDWNKLTNPSLSTSTNPAMELDFNLIDFELDNNDHGEYGFAINSYRTISIGFKPSIIQIYMHKTMDGGQSWGRIPIDSVLGLVAGYDQLTAMDFTDTLNGYVNICTYDSTVFKNNNTVYKTNDGGLSWNPVLVVGQTMMEPLNMSFYDENNGIIVGTDGTPAFQLYQYSTSDGGQTWQNSGGPALASKYHNYYGKQVSEDAAYFLDASNIGGSSTLARTADSGFSWDTIDVTGTDSSAFILAMDFLDNAFGYVYLSNGDLKVTADGGNFWSTADTVNLTFGQGGQTSINPGMDLNVTRLGNWGEIGVITAMGTNSYASLDISLSINEKEKENFSIYPNPLMPGQTLRLEFENRSERNISLVDITGKTILKKTTNALSEKIRLPFTLSRGVYFIYINNDNILTTNKIQIR